MDAMTFTQANQNLAKTIQQVCDDHVPVIVTRENEPAAVIMSLEDYQSLEETAYLLRSPKNAQRLLASVLQLNSSKGIEKELMT
ncbi:MAG TPA: type II toxin-antitoxin system prevent-host-death family antitoxin [Thioploca sp.]|nr:MAG: type II toxin-antitoxin system prevent-host-death family antitoxin [Gammaproteobacteria bacterium]HDN25801.1 type II toxin-antitoxin system prevent-host-death family antitoxin [Thioploca sp.]